MEQKTIEEGKTMAIIAYVTVIGTIIAYFMNKDKNNAFAAFHIKQGFRLFIFAVLLSIVTMVLVMFTGSTMISYLGYISWIFVILGILNASGGKEQKLPIIG
jgi:uncharacterized membrane protein